MLTESRRLRPGTVALVGAGPGAPDLLTRRAADRLAEADLVLYDALVDPAALVLAVNARRVFVGKRAGRPAVRQSFINRLMIRAARRGRKVVRLKGGDPFVFGRGGEEGVALAAAGVPFEVVPGVSAATAAATLAGIPVTHRGVSSAFVVVSGHAATAYRPVLESLAPHSATIVVLMGTAQLRPLAALLVDRGWDALTPVAALFGASTHESSVRMMTLGEPQDIRSAGRGAAGTLVIGDVVAIRDAMREGLVPELAAG